MAETPRVRLYFSSENPSGRTILSYLMDKAVLSSINRYITIDFYDIKYQKNKDQMRKDSITRVPALAIGRKCITGSEPIIDYFKSLTKPAPIKHELSMPEPEEDLIEADFQSTFKDRMMQLESRRNNVHAAHSTPQKKPAQKEFTNDDDFLKNVGEAPAAEADPSTDEYVLENYFNEEADKCGRKPYRRK